MFFASKPKIRRLTQRDRAAVLALYLALDSDATHSRFGFRPGTKSIEIYVSNIDFSEVCFGAFKKCKLIGLCESKPIKDKTSLIAMELAFVTANPYIKTGVGHLLGRAVLAQLTTPVFVLCSTINPAMVRLAWKLGLAPIHPSRLACLPEHLRSYAEDSVAFLSCDAEDYFDKNAIHRNSTA